MASMSASLWAVDRNEGDGGLVCTPRSRRWYWNSPANRGASLNVGRKNELNCSTWIGRPSAS